MRARSSLLVLAVLALPVAASCGPPPVVNPPPVPPPVTYLFKEIFWSTTPDPTGVHAPPEPHSCAIIVEPADPSLHAPYSTVDPYWKANGWAFWTACVIAARDVGFTLPAVKITGDPNERVLDPSLPFYLETAPVFGRGSGHYANYNATNIAVWRRAYIEVTG